jgi:hypothetical protein
MDEKTQRAFNDLQAYLRKVDSATVGSIMSDLHWTHLEVLRVIHVISEEYREFAHEHTIKVMTSTDKDMLDQYFQTQIVDLSFLAQHKIKEVNDAWKHKLDTAGHQMFYSQWLLHRGY